jgi:hypothetical protein
MELLSFRDAIRRIEFGDMDERQVTLAADYVPEPAPAGAVEAAPLQPAADLVDVVPEPPQLAPESAPAIKLPRKRKSVLRRVVRRGVLAALLLAAGIAAYTHASGQLDLSPLTQLFDQFAALDWSTLPGKRTSDSPRRIDPRAATEPAELLEPEGNDPRGKRTVGKATWRAASDSSGSGPVLTFAADFPDRGFSMEMRIRKDDPNSGMSHLFEIQFWGSERFPVENIARVYGVLMKDPSDRNGEAMVGQLIPVSPGLFLFGLSALPNDLRHNLEAFHTHSRFEIPFSFPDGTLAVIVIDKGQSGERLFADALEKWRH